MGKYIALMFVGIALTLFGCGMGYKTADVELRSENRNLYSDCGVIIDEPDETVLVTMQNGNVFAFENNDEWMIGDLVSILFDNNGTPEVYDDIIVRYRYSGWISGSEIENWIKEGK